MAALARWCVRHRLVAVLLWLLALGGTAAAAAVAGSAYSNDYEVPGTESGRATAPAAARASPASAATATPSSGTPTTGTVRAADVEQTDDPDARRDRRPARRRRRHRPVRRRRAPARSARTGAPPTPPSPSTSRPTTSTRGAGRGRRRHRARRAETDGLQVELGGSAIALTEASGGHLAEIVGVVVAAVVLFLAFGSLAAIAAADRHRARRRRHRATPAIVLLGHAMTVADFAPDARHADRARRRHRLRAVHRHPAPQGPAARAAGRRGGARTPSPPPGRAVVFAGATVCIALLGMLILRLSFLNGVAIAASLTVVLTVAASVTLLPALLVLHRHARPQPPRAAPARRARARSPSCRPASPPAGPPSSSATPSCSARVAARRHGWSSPCPRSRCTSAPPTRATTPRPPTTRQAYDLLAEGFGPGVNGPLTLVAAARRRRRPARPRQPAPPPCAPPRASRRSTPVTYNGSGDTGVLTVVPDVRPAVAGDQRARRPAARRRPARSAETAPRCRSHVGGVTASYDDFADVIVGKLPLFVGVVIGLGCLLLLLAFRSIGIPLKAAADERGRRRRLLRRRRRDLPVGLGQRAARASAARARSSPSCR